MARSKEIKSTSRVGLLIDFSKGFSFPCILTTFFPIYRQNFQMENSETQRKDNHKTNSTARL